MGETRTVVIVGGGISGLSAAFYTVQAARRAGQPVRVHVLEASHRWGGVIHTVVEDGFVVEGGPDSMLSYKPAGLALCRDLGLMGEVVGTSEANRGSFVYSRGELHPLPEGLTLMIPARLGPLFRTRLISWRGKLRAALDLVRTRYPDGRDISVARFVSAYLGQEVFDRIVEPLFAGIYGGDARALSVAATYPQLLELAHKHGSLLRGLLAHRRQARKRRGNNPQFPAFVTLRRGLGQLVEALIAHLQGAGLHPGVRAVTVRRPPHGPHSWEVVTADGTRLAADAVMIAVPAAEAARLVEGLDPELAHLLVEIPYAPTVTVSLAYPARNVHHPLNGYGFVVPRVEGRALSACTWTSSKFPHRAPEGYVLLRAFLAPEAAAAMVTADEEEIQALVRAELRATMGLKAPPERVWVFRWPQALPQYVLGHTERVKAIEARLASWPGLHLIGNAYRGVGIPDCIASGRRAAEAVFPENFALAPSPSV